MRFFELLNNQHVIALVIIAVIFCILFGIALAFVPTSGTMSEARDKILKNKAIQRFADNIEKAEGPFPLIITLLIAGTILWGLFYILFYGFSEVIL